MNVLFLILKGMMIGIANVIPGVSGGTMAVSLGIYDRLIGSVSRLFKDLRKSLSFLLPILGGAALGIVGFSYAIEYLLEKHTFITCMAFVGLILGGLPMLFSSLSKAKKENRRSIGIVGILAFAAAFIISAGLPLLKAGDSVMTSIPVTAVNMLLLFVIGIIASATMVVPGVSGSMILMIMGYYYGIINSVTGFLDALRAMDLGAMKDGFLLLFPFGLGMLLGIFLIAKLITFLFERFCVETYCAILGLVVASPVAIFINTGLFLELSSLSVWSVLLGILLMAAGAVVTQFVGESNSST